jgi:osmotically-inducible protein OsmY
MAYEEHEAKRSRVVVETPTSRREVVQSEAVRTPERNGISGGTVGVIVVLAVALVTILVLLLLSGQTNDTTASDLAAQQPAPVPQTTIIQQPASQQQPPVIIQQPAPATQAAPIIVNQPAPSGGNTSGSNDATIQMELDKQISNDPVLSTLGLTTTVLNGRVTLIGTVKTEAVKAQIERMALRVKGVTGVDNQIVVLP